ncbi:hypothetical protein ANANG_G00301040 [Anguilla anguilla]|uniref:Domain of unknown function with conserved HDNR motif domain-containing protein n=1 Tax=Anguilla anguilla TaxID=7936 RepID=A0A9D3LLK9_ANGAN|nr:hypothetical protein ANANG_G00301040 [Anguilla anguilla]
MQRYAHRLNQLSNATQGLSSMESDGWKTEDRDYPYSAHDNKATLQSSIEAYDNGLGRKKFLGEKRQHNSHFCLSHDGTARNDRTQGFSAYQTDYRGCQETDGVYSRRFPRNHLERTRGAAAQADAGFMWFGRHDSKGCAPLGVLAAANLSCLRNPGGTSTGADNAIIEL